ncbi:MAG: c-type cytochrome [Gammaproteobacteria bacterium]|nr:c-type cytochrome [Gammaproteobacteria bacterium]
MSAEHDRQFFDTFMIVLGALVAFTIFVYFLANAIHDRTQGVYIEENPIKSGLIAERLAPVATVAITGQPEPVIAAAPTAMATQAPAPVSAAPAPEPEPEPEPESQPAAATAGIDGEAIYNSACMACHMVGVAGAPKLGDTEAWAPRIANGIDTLYTHSIDGFQGATGVMPPKGGRLDLSDDEIKAGVDFMVEAAQ